MQTEETILLRITITNDRSWYEGVRLVRVIIMMMENSWMIDTHDTRCHTFQNVRCFFKPPYGGDFASTTQSSMLHRALLSSQVMIDAMSTEISSLNAAFSSSIWRFLAARLEDASRHRRYVERTAGAQQVIIPREAPSVESRPR